MGINSTGHYWIMFKPIKWISGVNNKMIFKRIRKMPMVTKQKMKTAKPKKNLNKPSLFIYFYS